MKKQLRKTIEGISIPNTASDLWDELYRNDSIKSILSFREGASYKIRLVGPFVVGNRIFIPQQHNFKKLFSASELHAILKGNDKVFNAIIDKIYKNIPDQVRKKSHIETIYDIRSDTPKGKQIVNLLLLLDSLMYKRSWQPVVYSNAIILDSSSSFSNPNPSIICLNKAICHQMLIPIVSKCSNKEAATSSPISGLVAYDFTISRTGNGMNTKYTVKTSDRPVQLERSWISYILKQGLLDIHGITKSLNKKTINNSRSGYIYRVVKEYKMGSELMSSLYNEISNIEESDYIEEIEENINELPKQSFEDYANENTIGSLEL